MDLTFKVFDFVKSELQLSFEKLNARSKSLRN
jgi:hypothetical protein